MSEYPTLELFIGGEWRGAAGRATETVVDPATGLGIGDLPHAGTADLDDAVAAAEAALPGWRTTSPLVRANLLRKGAQLMRERIELIASTLTREQGKPLSEAKVEVMGSADIIDWMADEGRRAYGRVIPAREPGWRQSVIQQPVGVVAAFSPWNFPAILPARKIGGSLAAGCTCILKPSEETPATALLLAKCLQDAGLPKGVLNVVFGVPDTVSRHLLAAPGVRKISFTGSVAVGKHLGALAAAGMKRATMELGGHAPVLVFDDVDAGWAGSLAATNKFRNAGQVCVSPTRFYVQDKVHDAFVDSLVEAAKKLKVGNGLESGVTMGALANPRRVSAMESFIADAVAKGAKLHTGGERVGNAGYFWQPTILSDVPDDARMMREEPFGPVAAVVRVKDEEQAIARANALEYGLAAYAFTRDADRQVRLGEELESGMVGLNTYHITLPETPFGGVKDSGYGSEGGVEGLEAYLSVKYIAQAPSPRS
jgi:succinate-semialdehyde dehydrogenase / glutarate-semialdehyde dehydrogenase